MARVVVCDKCGCHTMSNNRVSIDIKDNPNKPARRSMDFCQNCWRDIEQFMTSKYAEIAYHTPGAR